MLGTFLKHPELFGEIPEILRLSWQTLKGKSLGDLIDELLPDGFPPTPKAIYDSARYLAREIERKERLKLKEE